MALKKLLLESIITFYNWIAIFLRLVHICIQWNIFKENLTSYFSIFKFTQTSLVAFLASCGLILPPFPGQSVATREVSVYFQIYNVWFWTRISLFYANKTKKDGFSNHREEKTQRENQFLFKSALMQFHIQKHQLMMLFPAVNIEWQFSWFSL